MPGAGLTSSPYSISLSSRSMMGWVMPGDVMTRMPLG